jgi:hypothetical protein
MHTKTTFNVALLLLKLLQFYPYNFNNNKATLKSGFSVHQLVCNLI